MTCLRCGQQSSWLICGICRMELHYLYGHDPAATINCRCDVMPSLGLLGDGVYALEELVREVERGPHSGG